MPDITVTPELASIIKRERTSITPRLSAKDLSKDIGKSETYISTLERGNIGKIDQDTFIQIFKKISPTSGEDFNEYLNSILKEALANIQYSKDELVKQNWMHQLNLIIREIPIPTSVVDFIKNSLNELQITDLDLTNKINQNTYFLDKEKYEENKLHVFDNGQWAYKFNITSDIVSKILNRETTLTNYITMLGILYNLFLLKGDDNPTASKHAKEFLKNHKFYDLNEIIKVRHQYSNKDVNQILDDEYSLELPKYEQDLDNSLKEIKNYITRLRNIKIDRAIRLVKVTESNIQADSAFMTVLYSIPFSELFKDLSKQEKQGFLTELSKLIDSTIQKNKLPKNTDDEYNLD